MTNLAHRILKPLASLNIALLCLAALLVLVFVGTLDQVNLGIYFAQKKYFQSYFVTTQIGQATIPIFPGGFLVGIILIINLSAVILVRKLYKPKKFGLLLIHIGLIMLLLAGGLTSLLGVESQLAVEEGQTKNYSESTRIVELAVVNTSEPNTDTVTSIPENVLSTSTQLAPQALPFQMVVKAYFPNAQLSMRTEPGAPAWSQISATQGLGTQIHVLPLPVYVQPDVVNLPTALIELIYQGKSLGTWLLSRGLGAPQAVTIDGTTYTLAIRPYRYYTDYTLHLKDFSHDVYPGTQIPKNFSSLVHLEDTVTGESRDALIYMNHPLRYKGKTYYQASFGKNDTLSVLQVVENPGWLLPYVSCTLISIGMLMHFLSHLIRFTKRSRA